MTWIIFDNIYTMGHNAIFFIFTEPADSVLESQYPSVCMFAPSDAVFPKVFFCRPVSQGMLAFVHPPSPPIPPKEKKLLDPWRRKNIWPRCEEKFPLFVFDPPPLQKKGWTPPPKQNLNYLSLLVSVLLSALVKIFSVSRMRNFFWHVVFVFFSFFIFFFLVCFSLLCNLGKETFYWIFHAGKSAQRYSQPY